MAIRPTMAALVLRVRDLIADPAGTDQAFTDDQIQEKLDAHRTRVRYATLEPLPTPLPSGSVAYLDYRTPNKIGDWEGGTAIAFVDSAMNTLTPATPTETNYQTGEWAFPAGSNGLGQIPPVYITGYTYDIYFTASELLTQWAAQAKEDVNTSQQGVSIQRGAKKEAILSLAHEYAARRRPRNIAMRDAASSEQYEGGWPR